MNYIPKQFMSRTEAAAYATAKGVPVSKNTLQKFATVGGGPIYRRFGNKALYVATDMDAWIAEKMSAPMRSTSEHNAA